MRACLCLFALAVPSLLVPSRAAALDAAPPELRELSFSKTTVDCSLSNQTITVTARIVDDASGLAEPSPDQPNGGWARLIFQGPRGSQSAAAVILASNRVSGDERDGIYVSTLTLPKWSEPGVWTLREIGIQDASGPTRQMIRAQFVRLGFPDQIVVEGTGDISGPELREFNLSSTTVDTSSSSQTVAVTFRIVDDLNGIAQPTPERPRGGFANCVFRSPSGNQSASVTVDWTRRMSGTDLDGIYAGTMTLPRLSEPGTWKLARANLADALWNRREMDLAQFIQRGFPTQFTVLGDGDVSPPQLNEFTLSTMDVDASAANQTVTIQMRIVDDLSGIVQWTPEKPGGGGARVTFRSPSGQQSAAAVFYPEIRVAGDDRDGVYTSTLILPQWSERGVWTLSECALYDALGNQKPMDLAQFIRLGFPHQIRVRSQGDSSGPELREFNFSPPVVNISSSNQLVTVTTRVTDDLVGLGEPTQDRPAGGRIGLYFYSPSKNQSVSLTMDWRNRIAGSDRDGVYFGLVTFPRSSETGVWMMTGASLQDALGNRRELDLGQFLRLGFPTQIRVEGSGDDKAPELTALSLDPVTIDTTRSNQTMMVSVRVVDAGSGIGPSTPERPVGGWISLAFRSPSKNQTIDVTFDSRNQISGNDTDGVYLRAAIIPKLSEPGVWTLSEVELRDAVGNSRELDLAQVLQLGLTYQFSVQGAGDVEAPVLRQFDLSMSPINTASGGQSLIVTARLTDNLSGIGQPTAEGPVGGSAAVEFTSPSKKESVAASFDWKNRISGGPLNGVYIAALPLPNQSEPGVWTMTRAWLRDGLGNLRQLDLSQFVLSDFTREFTVVHLPSLSLAKSGGRLHLSWPAWASNFTLQSAPSLKEPLAWVNETGSSLIFGQEFVLELSPGDGQRFYRLRSD